MKCHDLNSDKAADIRVLANGLPCPEYGFPPALKIDYGPRTVACFIPVSDSDIITIKGDFTGTVLHGTFDLLVDGSYLGDRRIEGAKNGVAKVVKRKLDILKALDMPPATADGAAVIRHQPVVEGELRALRLEEAPTNTFDEGGEFGVGTLVLNISVNQERDESYEMDYDSTFAGEWKEKRDYKMNDAGVTPTHQLELVVTDKQVHHNRQSKHRRHFRADRPGQRPWATIVFFYRSIKAISDNACQLLADDSHALSPVVPSKSCATVADGTKRQGGQRSPFLQPMTHGQPVVAPTIMQATSATKPRLFGHHLFSEPIRAAVGTIPFSTDMASARNLSSDPNHGGRAEGPMSFPAFPRHYSQPRKTIDRRETPYLASALEMAPTYGADPLCADRAPPLRARRTPKLADIADTSPNVGRRVKTESHDEDASFYPYDDVHDTARYMSPAITPLAPGKEDTKELSPPPSILPPILALHSRSTPLPSISRHPALPTATTTEPMYSPSLATSPRTHMSLAVTQPFLGSMTSQEASASSHRRKHSISSEIEADTMVKKSRPSERNAALRAQLEDKKRRNEALRVKVEEQRQRREANIRKREADERRQAELEAEENAELEKLIAAQDEEYESLQVAVEADEGIEDSLLPHGADDLHGDGDGA